MKVDDFDFDLPPQFIAQHPASPRDSARLLHVGGSLHDQTITDLPNLLRPGDLLVVNDTRVIPARLVGARGAATIEATLIKRRGPDTWDALARPARRLRVGDTIAFADGLTAAVADKVEGGQVTLTFDRTDDALMAALERVGVMPLPPYIKRDRAGDARDRDDYQTLFAARAGAVAAPTAGLHFTPRLADDLAARGIRTARLTLHVGAGTFLPIKVDRIEDHVMHSEWGSVDAATAETVNAVKAEGGRIVAVGTTSLRLLESAVGADGRLHPFSGETDIFITPGFSFTLADMLLTNFHLPRSTLFMLVCAFTGTERMKSAYEHAKMTGYRFYSYGDACLLERAA